jgi:hypothetical protein
MGRGMSMGKVQGSRILDFGLTSASSVEPRILD